MSHQKKNILFRISGGRAYGKELGTGHIYRAMNIASKLKPNKLFFLVEDYGKTILFLKKNGYKNTFKLKKQIDVKSDIDITTKLIHDNNIDILIVDKFDFNTKKFVKHMHKIIKTVVIPDVNKIDYDADLVINGFIGYENKIIKNRFGTKCILGPRYQIIHKNYEKKSLVKKKKYSILATFGGFDENNLFDIFCENLENYLEHIKVKIILGPATKKSKKLKKLELKYPKNLFIINETKNMRKEISETSFGFCAGGITTYEFATMNIPFAIICQYKHQVLTAKAWEKKKIAYNLGLPSNNIDIKIHKILNKIFSGDINLVQDKGYSIVDGFGAKRAANEIVKLF